MKRDSAKADLKKIQPEIDRLKALKNPTPKQAEQLAQLESQKNDAQNVIAKAENDAAFLKQEADALQNHRAVLLKARDLIKDGLFIMSLSPSVSHRFT
jgi:chromosome segregation ATPase